MEDDMEDMEDDGMEDDMAISHPLRSTATVATDRSSRWITQLSSHLGRKAEVREGADGAQLLQLAGGGHLERFAAAEGLAVVWQREATS